MNRKKNPGGYIGEAMKQSKSPRKSVKVKAFEAEVTAWTAYYSGEARACIWIDKEIPDWLRAGQRYRITPAKGRK